MRSIAHPPALVRGVLVGTLAFGVLVHMIALVQGRDWLLVHVLTPVVDVALVVPMAFAAVGLWRLRRRVVHSRRAHAIAYFVLFAYMLVSALVHLDTLVAGEVRYVARFPHWYSAVIIPVQAAMLVFAARLRFPVPTYGSSRR